MVKIDNLEVRYGDYVALSVTEPICFEEGDRIGIIGSNGAGKSTLVKSILGLTNYRGKITMDLRPDEISVHMQQNEYTSNMQVRYIMEAILGTKIRGNKKLQELIAFFDFEKCLKQKFSTLSGGQKQRMTIILILIQDTPLVFFDEVTSGLDFETRQQLMRKISDWYRDKNNTICMVSHYYEELEQIVNKILILDEGKVVDFGDKNELFAKYCGNSVLVFEESATNIKLCEKYNRMNAATGYIALSCRNEQEESTIIQELIKHNINFKRSNNDIELMSINAKIAFKSNNERKEAV